MFQKTHDTQNPNSVQNRTDDYRFGFNGMEMDNEIFGSTGSSYTAEFWQYDSRLGRRWNVDPMMAYYPWQSPYACFNNNPIYFADPSGFEGDPPKNDEKKGETFTDVNGKKRNVNCDAVEIVAKRRNFSGNGEYPETSGYKDSPSEEESALGKTIKGIAEVLRFVPGVSSIEDLVGVAKDPNDLSNYSDAVPITKNIPTEVAQARLYDLETEYEDAFFSNKITNLTEIEDYSTWRENIKEMNKEYSKPSDKRRVVCLYTDEEVEVGTNFTTAICMTTIFIPHSEYRLNQGDVYPNNWKPKYIIWGIRNDLTNHSLLIRGKIKINYHE